MEFVNNQPPPHVKQIMVSAHALRAIVWLWILGRIRRLSLARCRPEARGLGAVLTVDQATRNVVTCHAICLEFLKLYCAHFLLATLRPVTLAFSACDAHTSNPRLLLVLRYWHWWQLSTTGLYWLRYIFLIWSWRWAAQRHKLQECWSRGSDVPRPHCSRVMRRFRFFLTL